MSDRQYQTDNQNPGSEQSQTQAEGMGARAQAPPNANGGTAPETEQQIDVPALIAERDDYLDRLQRSVAEFANYRRRTDQERAQVRETANRALLAQLLPVVDDFQRALAAVPEDERETSWVQGISLIERKLWNVLERAGVSPIEAQGQPFNPAEHEAIASEPGTSNDTVVDVYQQGYRLGDGLLRPAMVKVGGKGGQNQQNQQNQNQGAHQGHGGHHGDQHRGQHRKQGKSATVADRWGREV